MDYLELVKEEFSDLPSFAEAVRVLLRLILAVILGGLVGLERGAAGKAAGLRTHSLVTLGAALVVIVADLMNMAQADQSRVLQGLVTGIGFIGGGAILKLTDERRIRGLTTAAGIWMTASIGIAIGAGKLTTALIATALTFVILRLLRDVEQRVLPPSREEA